MHEGNLKVAFYAVVYILYTANPHNKNQYPIHQINSYIGDCLTHIFKEMYRKIPIISPSKYKPP